MLLEGGSRLSVKTTSLSVIEGHYRSIVNGRVDTATVRPVRHIHVRRGSLTAVCVGIDPLV
jgi:hypothetical protein